MWPHHVWLGAIYAFFYIRYTFGTRFRSRNPAYSSHLILYKLKRRRSGRQSVQFCIWPQFMIYILNNSRRNLCLIFWRVGDLFAWNSIWFSPAPHFISSKFHHGRQIYFLFCLYLLRKKIYVNKFNGCDTIEIISSIDPLKVRRIFLCVFLFCFYFLSWNCVKSFATNKQNCVKTGFIRAQIWSPKNTIEKQ